MIHNVLSYSFLGSMLCFQKQPPEVFYKKGVVIDFAKYPENIYVGVSFNPQPLF